MSSKHVRNICKSSTNAFAKIIESTHDRESVFVISNLHWRHLSFVSLQLIASTNRALFCSVSHRVFQILTRRRQKAKNSSLRISTKLRRASHLFTSIMHSFVLFLTEFFRFQWDIDRERKIIYAINLLRSRRRRHRCNNQVNSNSKAILKYINHLQIFFLFFIFHSQIFFLSFIFSFSSSFSRWLSIASRMLLNESYWRMTILNSKWLLIRRALNLTKFRSRWKKIL